MYYKISRITWPVSLTLLEYISFELQKGSIFMMCIQHQTYIFNHELEFSMTSTPEGFQLISRGPEESRKESHQLK